MSRIPPESWLRITTEGLYCAPGDFFIDPMRPSKRALITHGHADHARYGHDAVLATEETLAIMQLRYGMDSGKTKQAAIYGEQLTVGDVKVTFVPAGHILGSAQLILEHGGSRIIVSGDYKRRRDPTCPAFVPYPCDVFVTEATFGLPVFRHPPDHTQIARLLHSVNLYPERCHLVGAYALGKCQRLICLLREAGYHETIYLHGALMAMCNLYRDHGIELGAIEALPEKSKEQMKGKIVMCPPSALNDRWSRRLPEPVTALASGWMTVRARARQKLVELPLVVSDHADWDELTQTIKDIQPQELWVTHGREDALVYYAKQLGIKARPLDLHGYDDEDD